MPYRFNHPDKKIESMASILILGGALPLGAAMLAQYALHLPPCHFCILQRWPYGLAMLCGVLSLLVARMSLAWRLTVAVGIMAFLATGALGLVHTGIETGFIKYTGGCVASDTVSVDAILASPIVACDAVMASFAGLSMASWNVLFAASMVLLVALQYRFERRQHVGR